MLLLHAENMPTAHIVGGKPFKQGCCQAPFVQCLQVVEVRARLQRTLGRPFPLEEVTTLTLAKLRELEKASGLTGRPAAAKPKQNPADGGPEPGADEAPELVLAADPAAKGLSGGGAGAAGAASVNGVAASAWAGSMGSGKAAVRKASSQPLLVSKASCVSDAHARWAWVASKVLT